LACFSETIPAVNLFRRHPGVYEQDLVPVMFAGLADRLVELVAPAPGERVLDVACGTGAVTRRLVERVTPGGQVTGLDLSEPMLDVARETVPGGTFVAGDAQELPFPDASFDAATCQQGLQFVPEPLRALRELRRVLQPGGRAGLALWAAIETHPGFSELAAALRARLGAEAYAVMLKPYALPDAAQVEALAREAGFGQVRLEVDDALLEWESVEGFVYSFGQGSVLSEVFAAAPPARLQEVVDDVAAAFSLEPSAPFSFERRSNLYLLTDAA
jgi:ubiquinone/menaquinone biosynthesis C-methylase UbiE